MLQICTKCAEIHQQPSVNGPSLVQKSEVLCFIESSKNYLNEFAAKYAKLRPKSVTLGHKCGLMLSAAGVKGASW